MWRRFTESVFVTAVGFFLSVVVIALLIYWLLVTMAPQEVIVPDVKGMELEKARRLLAEKGLQLQVIRWEFHQKVPPHHIIRVEDPPPGRKVREGREVLVAVSRGVAQVMVPNVLGLSVSEAVQALREAQLTLGRSVDAYSDVVPKGTVVGQQPPPGVKVAEGTVVNLLIAKGDPPSGQEVDWHRLPLDAKAAQVTIIVGGKKLQQLIRIEVEDTEGKRTIYRGFHAPGDRIVQTVIGYGIVKIRVFVDGRALREEEL